MSYELTIKSDDRFGESVNCDALEAYLVALPKVAPGGPDHFIFGDRSKGPYMEIDTELVSEGGDSIDPGDRKERNCIRMHVPAAFAETVGPEIHRLCREIAAHLRWRVYDEQAGAYLA